MKNISLHLVPGLKQRDYFSRMFIQGMLDRMATRLYNRPATSTLYPTYVNSIATEWSAIRLYEKTGNTAYLIEAAIQLMIEFMFPSHKKAYYQPVDPIPHIRRK